jgi:putative phosphoesterase
MVKKKSSLIAGHDIPFRVGIISDVHGNHYALQKALEIFRSYDVKKYIFLGDSIGYIPSLKALNLLYKNSDDFICIRGNHEDMLLNDKIPPDKDKIYHLSQLQSEISKQHKNFITNWKNKLVVEMKNKKFIFFHGSPKDYIYGYIYPDTSLDEFDENYDIFFMGNSHWAFDRSQGYKRFINPGSCGLPRDHGKYASIGIFNFLNQEYSPIRFDISMYYNMLCKEHPKIHTSVLDLKNRKKIKILKNEIT